MEIKQKQVADYIFIILSIIIEQNIGPTYAARLLYLYTSLIRIGVKIIKPQTTIGNDYQINPVIINSECSDCDTYKYYRYYRYYKSFRNNYIEYIAIESFKLLQKMFPDSQIIQNFKVENKINKVFEKTNKKFREFLREKELLYEIKSELKSFYSYLDNDGWKNGNEQIKLVNDYYIKPDEPIDVEKLNDPESWCLLEGQKMLGPKWGELKHLLTTEQSLEIESYLDKKYKEIDVVKENRSVLDVSLKLNDKQKISAEFWQGIPGSVSPAGFWTMFLYRYFKANDRPNSVQVDYFYKLSCAEFQASVTCWKIKYKYLQLRPIQCIRLNYPDEKFNYYFGESEGRVWKPFQETRMFSPPFPDFISGHSTFSSAAAYVLNQLIGREIDDNIKISTNELQMLAPIFKNQSPQTFNLNEIFVEKNSSLIQENVPSERISFPISSWTDMAIEAGQSRLYGGIHIDTANVEGLVAGYKIASMVMKNLEK